MPRRLTKMKHDFVDQVSRGLKPGKAAKVVGYSDPNREAWRLMRQPAVVEEIKRRRDALIQGDLGQLAIDAMRDLMGDETPAATRYQASKWVLEHAGHANPADAEKGQQKDLTDMNADELAQAVSSGMSALGELAQQLKGTHNIDGQLRPVRELEVLDDDSDDEWALEREYREDAAREAMEAEDADYVESDDSDDDFLT